MWFFKKIKYADIKVVTNKVVKIGLRTFLRTIFDRGYKSSFLSGVVNCGGFRIPDVSLKQKDIMQMISFLFVYNKN